MARLHAVAHGPNLSAVLLKVPLFLAAGALVASCAGTSWVSGPSRERFANPSLIYLETNQFIWSDAVQREDLACANGTPVVCKEGHSRLSIAFCGCFADD